MTSGKRDGCATKHAVGSPAETDAKNGRKSVGEEPERGTSHLPNTVLRGNQSIQRSNSRASPAELDIVFRAAQTDRILFGISTQYARCVSSRAAERRRFADSLCRLTEFCALMSQVCHPHNTGAKGHRPTGAALAFRPRSVSDRRGDAPIGCRIRVSSARHRRIARRRHPDCRRNAARV
jgi:hypothetical protein